MRIHPSPINNYYSIYFPTPRDRSRGLIKQDLNFQWLVRHFFVDVPTFRSLESFYDFFLIPFEHVLIVQFEFLFYFYIELIALIHAFLNFGNRYSQKHVKLRVTLEFEPFLLLAA